MRTKVTLIFTAVFLLTAVANAQVGSVLRNKLNKAINKEVQNKVDSAAAEKEGEAPSEARPRGLGMGILGGKTDIKHNDEYNFTGRIHMIMEVYDKKDVSRSDYYTYYNTSSLNAGIEVRIVDPENSNQAVPTTFIFDNENRCFMMLMQGEGGGTGIISTIPDDETLAEQTKTQKGAQEKPVTITKTGNSKMIAGYRCDEYKVVEEGEDGYSNVWMTRDVTIKADKRNWGKAGMPTYYGHPEFDGSMMLALESFDKTGKMEMKMETKEINDSFRHSVSTVGYSFIKMNFGQAGKK